MRSLKINRRGQEYGVFNIFNIGIIALIVVVFFGGLIYVMGLLNDTFQTIGHNSEGNPLGVNITDAADKTFGQLNSSIQALRLVALAIILGEILFFIVFASFKNSHPLLFFVYILIVFLAVMFAAPISNSYEALLQGNIYDGLLQSFTGTNFLLLNLPTIVLVVGILGCILTFISIVRRGDEGSL